MSYPIELYLISAIFSIWLVVSIFAQFEKLKWVYKLKYYDLCSMIPSWTFFAPKPGTSDFRILYRDRLVDGKYSPWKLTFDESHSLSEALWNPSKRIMKVVDDAIMNVLQLSVEDPDNKSILLSYSYIVLLNHIMMMDSSNFSEMRQFMITSTVGHEEAPEPEIMFISQLHRFNRD
ncbi:hypothetical protein BFP97_07485 [Roseivirga sp. 4D4]|uniref:hypothetical protein n=1 Tax=Roseivirga sp. 4D4 TaxID=1889784 RepID=UPI00085390F3|nr:hypothetical protein [Roseivirga sp. 4D4]OEK01367.1 hypothetical protein BFP97_07485 [Roseivirga sp. 4D4]